MARARKILEIAVALAVTSATVTQPASAAARDPLRITRFLGEQRVPHMMRFEGTAVGGLSGVDRDPRTGTWYFISDDRWRYDPARFYTGRLDIDRRTGAFSAVRLTGVTTLTRGDGSPYPAYGKAASADPESIRFDPWSGRLMWGDEGDRPDSANPDIPISPPAVRGMDMSGRHVGELRLPANLRLTDVENGPRRNSGFEGLAVSPRTITGITEGPRYEDGAMPTAERGSVARLTVWSRQGALRGQYAYPLDALSTAPNPPAGPADSGVSEILAIDEGRYLALERSWISGAGYRAKLYEIDLRGATNVLERSALASGGAYRPVAKRLVRDLSFFRPPVQNLESLAWGPRLATGECTLVIGSDDNFDEREMTQFMAFGVTGVRACR
ncbi:esterase-like activity of phytase family protein [Nonomuraea rosea]|uniref:Esterase-like activity of phytase family protein n=1 Tax=Nonomuraea rosea TaxID=638574 RepID=A0ABP6WVI1_9ACTN